MKEHPDHRVCPYFQANEPSCAARFTLERVSEVFEFCLGDHRRCCTYHELTVHGERLVRIPRAQAG